MEGPTAPSTHGPGTSRPRPAKDVDRTPPVPAVVPPAPALPEAVLRAFGARVLDPATAVTAPGVPTPMPTAYIANTLLVRGLPDPGFRGHEGVGEVVAVAENLGLVAEVSEGDRCLGNLVSDAEREYLDDIWQTQVVLRRPTREELKTRTERLRELDEQPPPPTAAAPPDAWAVLQEITLRREGTAPEGIALEHLMLCADFEAAAPQGKGAWHSVGEWGSVGHWGSVGEWGSVGHWGSVGAASQYGVPGLGGRTPVVCLMADPYRPTPTGSRPPVVAVLDTPVGPHDWFHPGRGTTVLGLPGRPTVAPGEGLTVELDGLLANEAGHGTFVAGIVRQVCPEAEILVLPVVPFAGAAAEKDVHDALALLLARQRWAIAEKKHEALVDVVNLSLGYYHESPLDAVVQDVPLKALLDRLAAAGVAVVAAAGNDGTTAKFYPAGFAVERESVLPETATQVPLVSVGAYNPGDATIALFSNSGSWVTTHRVGAAVVSTVPTTMRGSIQAGVRARRDDPTDRALIDPDDFTTGFASWSGTSFAAPVVAGQIACAVRDSPAVCDTAMDACVGRGLDAVRTALAEVGP